LSSVRVHSLDRERVVAALRALAGTMVERRPEVREVRLFGSLARGTRNPYADADLLVIVDRSDVPFRDRSPVYKPLGAPVPTDVLVCTQDEVERELAAGNSFLTQALAESIVLCERKQPGSP
jgi:predicted nucleotidyltransferase